MILSIHLALFAGAFVVVAPEAYRKTANMKRRNTQVNDNGISFKGLSEKSM